MQDHLPAKFESNGGRYFRNSIVYGISLHKPFVSFAFSSKKTITTTNITTTLYHKYLTPILLIHHFFP